MKLISKKLMTWMGEMGVLWCGWVRLVECICGWLTWVLCDMVSRKWPNLVKIRVKKSWLMYLVVRRYIFSLSREFPSALDWFSCLKTSFLLFSSIINGDLEGGGSTANLFFLVFLYWFLFLLCVCSSRQTFVICSYCRCWGPTFLHWQ